MRLIVNISLVMVLVLYTIGCDFIERPTFTEQLAEVGNRVPSYGGISFDQNEQLIVFIIDPQQENKARTILIDIFGQKQGNKIQIEPKVKPEGFSLANWRRRIQGIWEVDGITGIGLHPSYPYIQIGLVSERVVGPVEVKLDEIDFPKGSVILEITGRIIQE